MSQIPESVLIVGTGQAGLQVASSLREEGYSGRIRMLGNEPGLPYQRPPLSKSFLGSGMTPDELHLETQQWFADSNVELLAGEHVQSIDRAARRLRTAAGNDYDYGHLILATGARNRSLPGMNELLDGVFSLRSAHDALQLREQLVKARSVVVIGAGFLGLEAAGVALAGGAQVQVVEACERVMERVLSAQMSASLHELHQAQGLAFHFNARVRAIHGHQGKVSEVALEGGQRLEADLLLLAIGVQPNVELALECGLVVNNGVQVDQALLTGDPSVSAIGDCAAFPYAFERGQVLRLESVQNAVDQGRFVAQRLLGRADVFDQVPIFWSEQAGCRLQIAGVARKSDQAIFRGSLQAGQFSLFRYRADRLVCVESLNRPADHMSARRLLQRRLSPPPQEIGDPDFDLKAFLATAAATPDCFPWP